MNSFKTFIIESAGSGNVKNDAKSALQRGLSKMIRMDAPMKDDPEGEKYHKDKRIIDSFDLIEALEVVRKMFEDAEETFKTIVDTETGAKVDLSKGHRRGETQMNILRDVKEAIKSYYLEGTSEKEGMLKRRRYRSLVTIVLEPLVNVFKGMAPDEIFNNYNKVIDEAIQFVKNSDIVAHADDAYVVRQQIAREVQKAANAKRAVDGIMKLRQKKTKKKK